LEAGLVDVMINGAEGQKGLRDMPAVIVIGGYDNKQREGLVSLYIEAVPCADIVSRLNADGVRTHVRKNDYFSGNILEPLNRPTCVRVSMCHYNTAQEVLQFLGIMESIISEMA
jgi:cysteine desulfurase/selenocysteine lyase